MKDARSKSDERKHMAHVVEHRFWAKPGASFTASIYGAPPRGDGWEIKSEGYTIQWDDGTVGLPSRYSRADAATKDQAERIMQEAQARGFKGFQGIYGD
jgi:hypothetical protein